MRYIQIPGPVVCIDAATDKPTGETISFYKAVSVVIASLIAKQAIDTLDAIALRSAVASANVGEEVAIDSAWWEALKNEIKRTNALGPGYLLAATDHIRAVLDSKESPSKAAEKAILMIEQTNGASASA